ncbi:MAG: type II secretion system protein GspM [Sphingopyxis sp.]|nr:type II secretion system protein GspM [Sphingopyxis sp.]
MIASLTRWWQALSVREQRLVGVAGALAAAVLLWLILRPLVGYISGLGDEHKLAVERAARVEAKAALIKGAAAPANARITGPLDQWIAVSAGDTGLSLDRNEARGDGAATLAIASARAPAVIGWLAQLEAQGLVVDRLTITPSTDGSVGVTAEVRRP